MITYHYNGEDQVWYVRKAGVLHRIRKWFIWIGGWEKANDGGWRLFRRVLRRLSARQRRVSRASVLSTGSRTPSPRAGAWDRRWTRSAGRRRAEVRDEQVTLGP